MDRLRAANESAEPRVQPTTSTDPEANATESPLNVVHCQVSASQSNTSTIVLVPVETNPT